MSKFLVSVAALGMLGAAGLSLPANAAERHDGATNTTVQQPTDVSSQRRWRRHYGYRYYPRRHYGPRYGYYGGGYPITATAIRSGYYRPGIGVGIGPFGFRVF